MGTTKTEIFTNKQNKLAVMLKAIAHPARIAILEHIIKANACICGDMVDELGLAQSTVSQHLKELKNAGIIQGTIEGANTCYCIEPDAWAKLGKTFNGLLKAYKEPKSCC
jgi:predicted transcriptional regulator